MAFTRGAVLAVAIVLVAADARAALDNPFPEETVISPGVKVGYTFGGAGGFTFGVELAILFRTGPDLDAILAQGPTFNLSFTSDGLFYVRPGWEIVSWLIGLELGPALVTGRDGTHLGLGITPWLGMVVVPYATYTLVLGGENVGETGVYLKLPLCPACESSGGGGFDFHDHD